MFRFLLSYAVIKGLWRGLHKPAPMTAARASDVIRRFYVEPMRLWLEQPNDIMCNTEKGDK